MWVRATPRRPASWTAQAYSKAASRGTEMERVRFPPDLLRPVLRERPEQGCQERNYISSST
jgi:hypothetical protein